MTELILNHASALMAKTRSLPPDVQLMVELPLRKIFPNGYRRLSTIRFVARNLVGPLASSPLASQAVAHSLSRRPSQANRVLAALATLTTVTRRVHLVDWRLNLSGCRLSSITLDSVHSDFLLRVDLSGAELTEVRIAGELLGADMSEARLRRSTLIGSRIEAALLDRAEVTDVFFASVQARRISFRAAYIHCCTFADVDLNGADFREAHLEDVVFERCTFVGSRFEDVTFEHVDFLACRELDFSALPGRPWLSASGRERPALGASPRRLDRQDDGLPPQLKVRFSNAGTRSRPSLGYRLQTLARELTIWIAMGSRYREAREKAKGVVNEEVLAFVLPKYRWLAALEILFGIELSDTRNISTAQLVYEGLVEELKERHQGLRAADLPELVLVDGNFPAAHYIQIGGDTYIVATVGLEVMTTRLARYCIAWLLPPSISYMDRWPPSRDVGATRLALAEALQEFRRSGGDISGLGRVQIKGLHDWQAHLLASCFLSFALAHELSHHLHVRGLSRGAELTNPELQADLDAVLMLDTELDGDRFLLGALRDLDPGDIRAEMRRGEAQGTAPPGSAELPIKELIDTFLAGASRFVECEWNVGVVAAFILIFGGSVGYREDGGDLLERAMTVVDRAFGELAAEELGIELARQGSVLEMLADIFYSGPSRES
jgi:Pentapeptide repeats (9 copies)